MSNTERDRAQSDQTSDMIDADTGIDAPEDMVAEEVAFVSDDTVEEAEVIAAECASPPAMATAVPRFAGTVDCPLSLRPQQTTWPLSVIASEW